MPRTLMPTPDDPQPRPSARPDDRTPPDDLLDPEGQAVLDFLRGEYASAARGSAPTIQPGTTPSQPAQVEPPVKNAEPTGHDRLVYLPAASHCYAIVQYDPASARLVRRVVALFGDVGCAEDYARGAGYHLYDIVPATAVIPKTL